MLACECAGVPANVAAATLTATYNNLEEVKALFAANKGQIAGVILEPVVGNGGFIPPTQEFLQGLREVTQQEGALLCFDEVMTGFRISKVSLCAAHPVHEHAHVAHAPSLLPLSPLWSTPHGALGRDDAPAGLLGLPTL